MTANTERRETGSTRWTQACHRLQHVSCVAAYAALVWFVFRSLAATSSDRPSDSAAVPVAEHGFIPLAFLYVVRYAPFLVSLPFCLFNCLGLVLFNLFPPRPRRLQASALSGPACLCFRVVSHGLFPRLVLENMERNLAVCSKAQLRNFRFELVTDLPLPVSLPETGSRVRHVLVPACYRTPAGTLFKARALQYCLEPEVDVLSSDDDWIVHLDEETLLTEDAVVGIVNFVSEGRHHFGQGVIMYNVTHSKSSGVVNWLATLADSVRTGTDYGCLRFSLRVLHEAVFGWKGSFIVAKAAAEKAVTFDHGPDSSLAEDCFFACAACQRGYSFGFVEGEMLEQSAFTVKDYVLQRRRWARGLSLVARSRQLSLRYKLGPVLMTATALCLPLTALSLLLALLPLLPAAPAFLLPVAAPRPPPPLLNAVCAFVAATCTFLFALGTAKSFAAQGYGVTRVAVLVVVSVVVVPVIILPLEVCASIFAFWVTSKRNEFHIVQKDRRRHPETFVA